MTRTAVSALFLAVLFGGPWARGLRAQQPIGTEFRVSTPKPEPQNKPRLLFGPDHGFAVVWSTLRPACEGCVTMDQVFWKVYSRLGQPVAEAFVENPRIFGAFPPAVVRTGRDAFSILWSETGDTGGLSGDVFENVVLWSTGEAQGPTSILRSPRPTLFILEAAARLDSGEVALAGEGKDGPADACPSCGLGAFAAVSTVEGEPLTAPFQLNTEVVGDQAAQGVAADGRGGFLVTWWGPAGGPDPSADAFVQRFSPAGAPLSPRIRSNAYTAGTQGGGGVAADLKGNFVTTWVSLGQDGSFGGIYAQRFNADAEKVGPEFRVNTVTLSDQYNAQVAMDRDGNFVVVWQSFDARGIGLWDIKGQLFRKDGTPVGPEFYVNSNLPADQEQPYVAFADNGTFGAVWTSFAQEEDAESDNIYAQRFSASPGDEPCWVRGGKVFCDTGRTGGEPEIEMIFGGRPGETLLSGDFDGDGRDDLCARYGTRIRCDLDHRGAPAEAKVDFGLAGDTPLMGDLDGNGKAEVCVRRKRQFLCDTGHNGGKPEMRIVFGLVSDTPLFGDLDGDGRDDPCLWRAGHFLCDTAHDGNGAEIDIAFGQTGDSPALGDLDGDGRDDPCVLLRSGHLLCDTAHDGGGVEVDLVLESQPGDRPLIANFDAL